LEVEAIPARVIDELMGHQRSRRGELEGGSRIGARYRHTTPEMAARVIQALDRRLTLALQVAEAITPAERDRSGREFLARQAALRLGGSKAQVFVDSAAARGRPD
jgi:hypothetical protein